MTAADDAAADRLEALLLLQYSVVTADDAEARRLRAKAARAGAVLADLGAAVRARDARLARDVVTWVMDDDGLPATDDRCVHCAGWGYFPDVDGEGLDGDVPCGHCDQSGLEQA